MILRNLYSMNEKALAFEIAECYEPQDLLELCKQEYVKYIFRDNREHFKGLIKFEEKKSEPADKLKQDEIRIQIPTNPDDLLKIFLIIFSNKDILAELYNQVPENVKNAIAIITWEGPTQARFLEGQLGEKVIIRKKGILKGYDTTHVKDEFAILSLDDEYFSYMCTQTISLPWEVRKLFKKILPAPHGYNIIPISDIEKTEFVYEYREKVFLELPLCLKFINQGELKTGKNDKPLKSALNKLNQVCEIDEFYKRGQNNTVSIKTKFLATFLLDAVNREKISRNTQDPLQQFKDVHKSYMDMKSEVDSVGMFLSHLKRTANYQDQDGNVYATLFQLVRRLPANQWVSLDNLCRYVKLRNLDPEIFPLELRREYIVDTWYNHHNRKRRFGDDIDNDINIDSMYYDLVTVPLIKGSMFFFASIGLVDVAYNHPSDNIKTQDISFAGSQYEGLRYVRLNDFGAYVTGSLENYTVSVKQNTETANVILDDKRLVAFLDGKDRLKATLMEKMAEKTGESSFKFSYNSFLKGCRSERDIENKVNLFKKEGPEEIPAIWEKFLENVLARYNPIHKMHSMSIYKLSKNKELLQLIVKDPVLKKNILKVENYHIAIENDNFHLVKNRIESFGYIMQEENISESGSINNIKASVLRKIFNG